MAKPEAAFDHRHSMKTPPPAHVLKLFSAGEPRNSGAVAFVIGVLHEGCVMPQFGGSYMGAKWWWDLPNIPGMES
jgi:hypothetical protein